MNFQVPPSSQTVFGSRGSPPTTVSGTGTGTTGETGGGEDGDVYLHMTKEKCLDDNHWFRHFFRLSWSQ